jgi:neopullulanase
MPDVPTWAAEAVFYQIFPDRFARSGLVEAPGRLEPWDAPPTRQGFKGGNLPGAEERLGHLQELGVNAIYLNPIFASAANHRYHTYDYMAVDPLLGGTAAFRSFLDEAHRRGIRVVLDGVFNHSGRGFWPFHHVLETGADSPYAGWFHLDRARLASGRALDPYPDDAGLAGREGSGDRSLRTLGYRAWWDLPALPKINVDDAAARAYLLRVIETWTRFGIDGWRIDVPEEVAPSFWAEVRESVARVNPDAYLVGEIWHVAPEWVGSGPFHGLMNYPLAWAILGFTGSTSIDAAVAGQQWHARHELRPLDAAGFAARLAELDRAYADVGAVTHLNLLGSHDTPRMKSLLSGDGAAARLALMVLLSLPGAPCLYYGDEIGLMGGGDPDCRRAFSWEREQWDGATFRTIAELTQIRRRHAGLRTGPVQPLLTKRSTAALLLGHGAERIVLVINAGLEREAIEVALPAASVPAQPQLLVSVGGETSVTAGPGGQWQLGIPAKSGVLLMPQDA